MGKRAFFGVIASLAFPRLLAAQAAAQEMDYSGWGHHKIGTWWKVLLLIGLMAVALGILGLGVWLIFKMVNKKGSLKGPKK